MSTVPEVQLRPVVRFREFPFGTLHDPSIRDAVGELPGPHQDRLLGYLRSGVLLGVTMGADLTDWLDPSVKANPVIAGRRRGGVNEMTDGVWFWYAGLIHFVEKYNVRVPPEFLEHAARNGWVVDRERVPPLRFDFSYFDNR